MNYVTHTHFGSMEQWNDHPHGWEVDVRATCAGEAGSTLRQSAASRLLLTAGTLEAPTLQSGTMLRHQPQRNSER